MSIEVNTKQRVIEHPLEETLGIQPGTTVVEYREGVPAPIVQMETYDAKDNEIEEKLEEIYTLAMEQADMIGMETERVEGKYKARMGEVQATMLNVALGAVREKSALKIHKDKLKPGATPGTINNTQVNVVAASQSEILEMVAKRMGK